MQYLEAKAQVTPTTDRGEFKALVATYDRDREGDMIVAGAFAKTIMEWREVGRRLPLHWNHLADEIVGDVDPAEMWESDDEGLEVSGRIDLDDEQGRRVWKSLKRNRIAFSFGFVVKSSRKRKDGGRDLLELDVFEVSVTPSPMNNRTRVLSTKAMASGSDLDLMTDAELKDYSLSLVEKTDTMAHQPIKVASFPC